MCLYVYLVFPSEERLILKKKGFIFVFVKSCERTNNLYQPIDKNKMIRVSESMKMY
jgi:hypothetical protein